MNPLLEKLFGEATRLTRSGKLAEATEALQRALGGAAAKVGLHPSAGAASAVLEGLVRELPGREPASRRSVPSTPGAATPGVDSADAAATFEEGSYTGASGTRGYKLFVPAVPAGTPRPLIVMLHGCTQSPDDFAAGTRMNEIAQERGFLVLYPAQAARSNSSKCWNWFVPGDQRRGGGEPDLLAGMTRHVMATWPVDPHRVYVAGLSAGGSMADILGREYPELYAAVGVHSGLAQGSAHDIASAFAAMQGGAAFPAAALAAGGVAGRAAADAQAADRPNGAAPPTIVFHGDRDSTVHPSNGEQVISAAVDGPAGTAARVVASTEPASAAGRAATRTIHRRQNAGRDEPSLAEHWVVHGTGHAWSGGSARGSYTDAAGPDASREMVRFFEEHPLRGVRPEPRRWF